MDNELTDLTYVSESRIAVGGVDRPHLYILDAGSCAVLQCFAINQGPDAYFPVALVCPPRGGFVLMACVEQNNQDSGRIYRVCVANDGATRTVEHIHDDFVQAFMYA